MVGRLGLSLLYHPMQKNNTASSSGIRFYLGSSNLLSSKTDDESNAGDKDNIGIVVALAAYALLDEIINP